MSFGFEYKVFYSAEDDGYIAKVVNVPDLIMSAWGATEKEAISELQEAWKLWEVEE